jgi:hypothetical protein
MYGVGIDDRTMRIESNPLYLDFPVYPEATLQIIDDKGAVVAENNSLKFPLQGAIDRYYTSPDTELALAWDVKNVDSCEISVPGSGLTLDPIREGISEAGSMIVTTGSQYGAYVLNCLGNSYEQYGFPDEQRNDAEAVVKITAIDPTTDTMTLETLERALDGFDDWITDNGHPVIPINTVVREESVGAYNGHFIDRLYWCSGNCTSGARHNVIYRGVSQNQCSSLNGFVLRNQEQYIGCSPLAN